MTNKSDTAEKTSAADELKTQAQKAGRPPYTEPVKPVPVEVMDLAPTEPYPTGSPADPEDQFAAAHGYRREAP